jgi:hypothetical protein
MTARTNGNHETDGAATSKGRRTNGQGAARTRRRSGATEKQRSEVSGLDASYNTRKEFQGQQYTGMKVGRGHKWKYDAGDWVEKKVTPDKWEFHFDVTKRRSGKAPEGSGVPVGTEYHWYVLAHQTATKIDANDYETHMQGFKYKLAHKRADKTAWSASEAAQTRRLIAVLEELIADLKREPPKAATARTSRRAAPARSGAKSPAAGKPAASKKEADKKEAPDRAAA